MLLKYACYFAHDGIHNLPTSGWYFSTMVTVRAFLVLFSKVMVHIEYLGIHQQLPQERVQNNALTAAEGAMNEIHFSFH